MDPSLKIYLKLKTYTTYSGVSDDEQNIGGQRVKNTFTKSD